MHLGQVLVLTPAFCVTHGRRALWRPRGRSLPCGRPRVRFSPARTCLPIYARLSRALISSRLPRRGFDYHMFHSGMHGTGRRERRGAAREQTPLLQRDPSKPQASWLEIVAFCRPYIFPPDTAHRLLAALALFAVLVGKVLALAPPLAMKYAVDLIADAAARGHPVSAAGPLYALFLFLAARASVTLVGVVENISHNFVSANARRRFGVDLYEHLISLSLSYHLNQRSGEVMRIMNRSTSSVTTLMNVFLFTLMPTIFETMLVTFVFFKLGEIAIAAAVLCSVVVYFVFTVTVTTWRTTHRRQLNEADNDLADKTYETLSNLESVKIFQKDDVEVADFNGRAVAYQKSYLRMTASLEFLNAGQSLIRLLGLVTGLAIAAIGTVRGTPRVSPGTFVSINLFIAQLFQPLAWLGSTYRQVTNALTDLERAMDMLKEKPDIVDAPDAIPLPLGDRNVGGSVEFRNVFFKYDTQRSAVAGLNNVSFSLPEGKTLAFVGETGSGKTSIVRVLLRLYDISSGAIFVNGHDIRSVTQKSLRENIGVVPQEPTLFNESLRYNIAYGCNYEPTDVEVYEAARAAALSEFVLRQPDKLDTVVGERGVRLSGGERARVGLARCLIKKPSIILLDEATAALDSRTEQQVQQNIAELCRGRTTIVIAHRLSTVCHADEIILISNGAVLERGTHAELLDAGGEYADLWRIQTENAMGGPGSLVRHSSSSDVEAL